MIHIQDLIRNKFAHSFTVCGFLRTPGADHDTLYSDLDLFLIQNGGTPSDYFGLALSVLCSLVETDSSLVVYASFRQQMLLRTMAASACPTMLHYLHYLSIRHLISREINTLPFFVSRNLVPIIPADEGVLAQICYAYNTRTSLLHPSWLRFYYYFDIANEALPMIANMMSRQLQLETMIHELIHKLKFLSQCLRFEIIAEHKRATQNRAPLNNTGELSSLGITRLAEISRAIHATINSSSLPSQEWIIKQFRELYTCFDQIECLSDSCVGGSDT